MSFPGSLTSLLACERVNEALVCCAKKETPDPQAAESISAWANFSKLLGAVSAQGIPGLLYNLRTSVDWYARQIGTNTERGSYRTDVLEILTFLIRLTGWPIKLADIPTNVEKAAQLTLRDILNKVPKTSYHDPFIQDERFALLLINFLCESPQQLRLQKQFVPVFLAKEILTQHWDSGVNPWQDRYDVHSAILDLLIKIEATELLVDERFRAIIPVYRLRMQTTGYQIRRTYNLSKVPLEPLTPGFVRELINDHKNNNEGFVRHFVQLLKLCYFETES